MQEIKDYGVEIELNDEQNFLKIKETLTRIGIASKKDKTLYQSCHILHKRGKYYIIHFLELFRLDGKQSNISSDDIGRRNRIAQLLEDWGLCEILEEIDDNISPVSSVKIIPFKSKKEWNLVEKYSVGKK